MAIKKIQGTKQPSFKEEVRRRVLPSFTITSDDLKEIKDWKNGEDYTLRIRVRQKNSGTGTGKYDDSKENEKKSYAEFEMIGIESMENSDHNSDNKSKKSYSEEYGEKRSKAPRA